MQKTTISQQKIHARFLHPDKSSKLRHQAHQKQSKNVWNSVEIPVTQISEGRSSITKLEEKTSCCTPDD
jgi:hypothetical protein